MYFELNDRHKLFRICRNEWNIERKTKDPFLRFFTFLTQQAGQVWNKLESVSMKFFETFWQCVKIQNSLRYLKPIYLEPNTFCQISDQNRHCLSKTKIDWILKFFSITDLLLTLGRLIFHSYLFVPYLTIIV